MSNRSLVSVIIPAYNAESYIDDALRSVLGQTFSNLEIVVVDDGSTDGTADRVAAYGPRVLYYRRTNSGGYPGVARNTGIERCSGEYICFLDADDIMLPDRVKIQAKFLSEHPAAGLVFADYQNFSPDGLTDRSHFRTCPRLQEKLGNKQSLVMTSSEATTHLLQENFGGAGTMMIRREVLDVVPSFSAEMQVGEDFHFYYQMARHFGLGITNQVGTLRRLHHGSVTSNPLRLLHGYILSRSRLRDMESNATDRRLLNRFLVQCEIDLARAYSNRRELRKAIVHNLRALAGAFPASLDHLGIGLWTLVRTGAIAVHLKTPDP